MVLQSMPRTSSAAVLRGESVLWALIALLGGDSMQLLLLVVLVGCGGSNGGLYSTGETGDISLDLELLPPNDGQFCYGDVFTNNGGTLLGSALIHYF